MLYRVPVGATVEDLIRVGEANPGVRVELGPGGELLMSPPAGGESARRNADLTAAMRAWAATHDYVAFDSSVGFTLPDGSVRSPDASLVRRDVWNALSRDEREGFAHVVPEVAIELASRSDRASDLRSKLEAFRRFGAAFVVLLDPYAGEMWTDGAPPATFDVDLGVLLE